MTYSCTDFVDSILDALNIELEDAEMDDPSAQADKALEAIAALRAKRKVVVEVLGGVADVTECPDDVDVEIIDHDNENDPDPDYDENGNLRVG